MSNLDKVFLRHTIARQEEDRQFRCRLDILKDREQKNMWDFIHECIRSKNKRTKDQTERE